MAIQPFDGMAGEPSAFAIGRLTGAPFVAMGRLDALAAIDRTPYRCLNLGLSR